MAAPCGAAGAPSWAEAACEQAEAGTPAELHTKCSCLSWIGLGHSLRSEHAAEDCRVQRVRAVIQCLHRGEAFTKQHLDPSHHCYNSYCTACGGRVHQRDGGGAGDAPHTLFTGSFGGV